LLGTEIGGDAGLCNFVAVGAWDVGGNKKM
jgi:hypothetical protein